MKEVRKLKFNDLGLASKIVKKLELRVDGGTKSLEELGASLFLKLIENYHIVEKDVAKFMSNLIEEMTEEEFLNLELKEVLDYINKLREDEGLTNFLDVLSKLVKTQ